MRSKLKWLFQYQRSASQLTLLRSVGMVVVGLVASMASLAATAEAATLDEIRTCVRENWPQSNFSQQISLTSWDGGGSSSELVGELFGERSNTGRISLMLKIEAPQDLNGARYLLNRRNQRDQMYVYLPALRKTRRIVGGMKGQPLWGTDFSYEDIRHLQTAMSETQMELLGAGELEERAVHQLKVVPDVDAESPYKYLEMDIDQQTCVPLQVRFFDTSGELKRMQVAVEKLHNAQGRWLVSEVSMDNLRGHTRSKLNLSKYRFDTKLSASLFNPKTFHLAN